MMSKKYIRTVGGVLATASMIRFRRNRRKILLERVYRRFLSVGHGPNTWGWGNKRGLKEGWEILQTRCADRASQTRIAHLLNRLDSPDRGAKESALAELELAFLIQEAGCSVAFLPESQARTADLACAFGAERFYVEVTALVGSGRHSPRRTLVRLLVEEGDEEEGHILIRRLTARISQKARQLSTYTDPVILSITVPPREDRFQELDLKQLAGTITVLLPRLIHVSAVLIALWDVHPVPFRSGVRLSNVYLVERSAQQQTDPRVRVLITNPSARAPLRGGLLQIFKELL